MLQPQYIQFIQANYIPGRVEVEARFGYFRGGKFHSEVPYVHFDRLRHTLQQRLNEEEEVSTVEQVGPLRRVIKAGPRETIRWEIKRGIQGEERTNIDIPSYEMRVSLREETEVPPENIPTTYTITDRRIRTRYSFLDRENEARVDLTEVIWTTFNPRRGDRTSTVHEVEVEYIGDKSAEKISVFSRYLERIFRELRGSNLLYTLDQKNALNRDVSRILPGQLGDKIDKGILVEARNLQRRDLVWGGIVGNRRTSYTVAYKADGLRKLLIFHTTGIWLVYPPYEFNLVIDLANIRSVKEVEYYLKHAISVFDGELAQPNTGAELVERIAVSDIPSPQVEGSALLTTPKNYPVTKYWYLAFDCLALLGRPVVNQPYTERREAVEAFRHKINNSTLSIGTKTVRELKTVDDFFTIIPAFIRNLGNNDYLDDGLIFTPEGEPYNPHSERRPASERVLTGHPDVCKWKPLVTIDFSIRLDHRGNIGLYVYDSARKEPIPFTGTRINSFHEGMVDQDDPLTRGLPSGTVVEYYWDREVKRLRPKTIRTDKTSANRIEIASDNWDQILHPLTPEYLTGQDFGMVYAYHNRIKRALYKILPGTTLLDIGSGRGGDVSKWSSQGLTVVGVEPNADNREELLRRLTTFNMTERVAVLPVGGEDSALIRAQVSRLPEGRVDSISLMLCLSFFWRDEETLSALVRTIVENLKPGGKIVFLTIDGDTVEEFFQPSLEGATLGVVKPEYEEQIKRLGPVTLQLFAQARPQGRPLTITLPEGTIVSRQEEYLVMVSDLTTRLAQHGIVLRELHRAETERLLPPEGALFSSLYSYGYYEYTNTAPILNTFQMERNSILGERYLQARSKPVFLPLPPSRPSRGSYSPRTPQSNSLIEHPLISAPTPSSSSPILVTPLEPPTTQPAVLSSPLPPARGMLSTWATRGLPSATQTFTPSSPVPAASEVTRTASPVASQPNFPSARTPLAVPKVTQPLLTTRPSYRSADLSQTSDDYPSSLNMDWYQNVVRITTLGAGDCFFHATLKAFYSPYQEADRSERLRLARLLRRDLAYGLTAVNPRFDSVTPGQRYIYWETAGEGSFPRQALQTVLNENLLNVPNETPIDYSVTGLQALLFSTSYIGDEIYAYISDYLGFDVYILSISGGRVIPHASFQRRSERRPGVVILGNRYHYETVGVRTEQDIQTIFYPDDPFLNAYLAQPGGDPHDETIFNPDETFASHVIEVLTNIEQQLIEEGLDPRDQQQVKAAAVGTLDEKVNTIFPDSTDPFSILYFRVRDRAIEFFNRLPAYSNPDRVRLETALFQLRQAGADNYTIQRIRSLSIADDATLADPSRILLDDVARGHLSADAVDYFLRYLQAQ